MKWDELMVRDISIANSLAQPVLTRISERPLCQAFTIRAMTDRYAKEFDRALEASGVPAKQLAADLGIEAANVSHWRRGRRPIPPVHAVAVARMVNSKPEEISEGYAQLLESSGHGFDAQDRDNHPLDDRSLVRFSYLPSHLDAGAPHTIDLPRQLFDRRPDLLSPGVMVAINNSDAMAGQIERGSLVFFDTNVKDFSDEGIYAYVWVGRPMIKFVQFVPGGVQLKGSAPRDLVEVTDAKSAKALEPKGRYLAQLMLTASL